jgi:hypothetical protein
MIYKCITVHYDFYWNYTALVELHLNIVNYLLGWFCYCQPYFNYLHHKNWTFTKYVKWAFDYWDKCGTYVPNTFSLQCPR